MTTANELTCPVCRAKQPYQVECRRCGADLYLWIKALRSLQAAQQQLAQSDREGDPRTQQSLAYLNWLSPRAAVAAESAGQLS